MTQMEALELALRLAIAAPDQQREELAVSLAEDIAFSMTKEEIETVKEEIEFPGFKNHESLGVCFCSIDKMRCNADFASIGRN